MVEELHFQLLEKSHQILSSVIPSVFGVTVLKINVFAMPDTLVPLAKPTPLLLVKIK